jgi:hypothetical protein
MPRSNLASAGHWLNGTGKRLGGLPGRAKEKPLTGSDYLLFPGSLPIKKPGIAGLLSMG